MVKIG